MRRHWQDSLGLVRPQQSAMATKTGSYDTKWTFGESNPVCSRQFPERKKHVWVRASPRISIIIRLIKSFGVFKNMPCYINFEKFLNTVRRVRFGVKTLTIKSNKTSHFINVLIVLKVSFYFRLNCPCKYLRCHIKKQKSGFT